MQYSTSFILAALVASTSAIQSESTALAAAAPILRTLPAVTEPTAIDCANPVSTTRADTNLFSLDARAYEPQTVTIQLYGTDDVARTTGGEAPTFRLEDRCATANNDIRCTADSAATPVTGLPIEVLMTDNSDGTYSHTFTTPGGITEDAVVTASISVLTSGGLYAEYFDDRVRTRLPVGTTTEGMTHVWGSGDVGLSGLADNVAVQWSGKLCAPTTETHTLLAQSNKTFTLTAAGGTVSIGNGTVGSFDVALTADTLYDIDLDYEEDTGDAKVEVNWSSMTNTAMTEVEIPIANLWSGQRIFGAVDIGIAAATVPVKSTIESAPTADAINLADTDTATFTLQSRNNADEAQNVQDDMYTVLLTCNDLPVCGMEQYTTTAVHTTDGLYSADLNPTMVGTYNVIV